MTKMKVILERFPYRFVQKGLLSINGEPDYRIQKYNELSRMYNDMYYLCLLYTSPSPRDLSTSRMPSSA